MHAAVLGELSSIPAAAAVAANDRVPWGPLYGGGRKGGKESLAWDRSRGGGRERKVNSPSQGHTCLVVVRSGGGSSRGEGGDWLCFFCSRGGWAGKTKCVSVACGLRGEDGKERKKE